MKFIETASLSSRYTLYSTLTLEKFAEHFKTSLLNSPELSFSSKRALRTSTLKGHISEITKGKSKSCQHTEFQHNSNLFIVIDCGKTFDLSTNRYTVHRITRETPKEMADRLLKEAEKEDKMKHFSFDEVKMKYSVRVYHNSDTGVEVPGISSREEKFATMDEAREYMQKCYRVWHMQMTLLGYASQIVHDYPNTMTVRKGNCKRKVISRFLWILRGVPFYDRSGESAAA